MKKILISAVALVFGVTAINAQSPWFLGGEVGFGFMKDDAKTKTTAFTVAPQVGYMLNDNWGLTLDLSYSQQTVKPDGGSSVTDFSTFGGAIGAIYKLQIVDKFYYAPTFKVGYENDSENKVNYFGADLNFLRFELRPACHWGINFNFGGLSYINVSPDEGNSASAFGLNVGDAMSVGFTYYF